MKRLKGQRQEERREKEQEKEPVRCMWSQVHYQPMTRLHIKARVTTLMKKKVSYGITVLIVTAVLSQLILYGLNVYSMNSESLQKRTPPLSSLSLSLSLSLSP